ncbi:hypothetical protein K8I31_04215, partial [bacterium]|nr:hypothetical protein [bacterium]
MLSKGNVRYPHSGIHPVSSTDHPELALLMEMGGGIGKLLKPLDNILKNFDDAARTISPIILDLNSNGVETVSIKDGAYFDHDANGFAEQTGWVGGGDGLLVRDLDGNGRIDTGRELFGDQTLLGNGSRASNGFDALAELDANHDGKIDATDAAWAGL